jgi:hypothetical protein
LNTLDPQPTVLATNPGDNKNPFKSINISPQSFIENSRFVHERLRENSIVSIVTTFERFLFDQLERILYLAPDKLATSDMEFKTRELVSIPKDVTFNRWLAARLADKILRNFTHREMVAKIGGFANFSLGRKDVKKNEGSSKLEEKAIEEWHKWTLVRNSIVHTARSVTKDLASGWPEKFPKAGVELNLRDEDVVSSHKTAIFLAEYIDKFTTKNVIKQNDAALLIRELYIQHGITDPRVMRGFISETVQVPTSVQHVEQSISSQRKGNADTGWSLTSTELTALIKHSRVGGII